MPRVEMAKLPDIYAERPTPRFGGRLEVPQVPDSGISQLGSAISGFGEILVKEQLKDDKYKYEDAITRLEAGILILKNGKQDDPEDEGYLGIVGGNIKEDFYGKETGKYSSLVTEISGTLGNENQREMFARRSDEIANRFNSNLINHISTENDLFQENAFKGSIDQSIETGTDVWSEPNSVGIQRDRIKDLIETRAEDQGWSKAQKDNALLTALSELNIGVITQAVDADKYKYASSWLKENHKDMTEEHELKAKDLIEKSSVKVRSQLAVDDLIAAGKTEKEAKAVAREETGELREAMLSLITNRYAEEAQGVDRAQRSFGESARKYYADGIDTGMTPQEAYDSIPASVLENMDAGERISLQSTVRIASSGETIKTDRKELYRLRNLYKDDRVAFNKYNMMLSSHLLSSADFEEMVKLQTNEKALMVARTKKQYLDEGAAGAGLGPEDLTADSDVGKETRTYYNRVDEELEAVKEMTGKDPELKDIKDITDRLNIEVIRKRSLFPQWMGAEYPMRLFGGDIEELAGQMKIKGVPSGLIDELAQTLIDSEKEVTEANIRELYSDLFGIPLAELPTESPRKISTESYQDSP